MSVRVTAAAHPNLALVKYWGKTDEALNLPVNNSISVNLGGALTTTSVCFRAGLAGDEVELNGSPADSSTAERVSRHLDRIRALAGMSQWARVVSQNDFPTATGIASSASAFAALSLAASRAAGLSLDARQLSILARRGSGSACRSVPGGFVEWVAGDRDEDSFARQIAPPDHWDLRILTVVLSRRPKALSSSAGHRAAWTSPLFAARLVTVPRTLAAVRAALLATDFDGLAMAVEREAVSMHAIAMTGQPDKAPWMSGLYYWEPETLRLIHAVQSWRRQGLPVCFTIDAGPNVHLLCPAGEQSAVESLLQPLLVERAAGLIVSQPGRGAWVVETGPA